MFHFSRDYLIVWRTIIENERFMITIYVFLFALGLKYYTINRKGLSNLYKSSVDGLFFLTCDYLIVWTTIMENERFMITIYQFLFPLVLKYYSIYLEYFSNLYNRSIVCSFSPGIKLQYEQGLWKVRVLSIPYILFYFDWGWNIILWIYKSEVIYRRNQQFVPFVK